MQKKIDVLKRIVAGCFKDKFYHEGIEQLRGLIQERSYYKDHWHDLIRIILLKELPEGLPMSILHEDGNQLLQENNDEEAYRWLTLMVINAVSSADNPILDYFEFLNRNTNEI